MARKPPVKLPDVFAKPGQAPSRGTPIEALPQASDVVMPPVEEPRASDAAAPATDAPTTVNSQAAGEVAPAPPSAMTVSAPITDTVAGNAAQAADFPTTVNPQGTDAVEGKPAPTAEALTAVTPQVTDAVDGKDAQAASFPTTVNPLVTDAVEGKPAPTAEALTTVNPQVTDAVGGSPATTADFPTTVNPQITDAVTGAPAQDAQQAAWALPSTPKMALPAAEAPEPPPVAPPPAAVKPAPEPAPVAHPSDDVPRQSPVTVPQPRGPAWAIAMVALGVSLTTPFWYDGALRVLGITTAISQAQQQDALSITRQERTLQDVQQRLTTANAQLSKARTDLTEAARQQEETAAWTRTMILVRLSEALRRGAPFVAEVAMVRSSGAATADLSPLIERIAPYATIGVPTAVDLVNDFRRVTDPVLRPNRGFNPMAWAATVVAWTPFSRPAADLDPGRAALRDAGARMRDGQINEAVAILRPVTGPVAEMMAGWLADTQARAAADALGTRVEAMLRVVRR